MRHPQVPAASLSSASVWKSLQAQPVYLWIAFVVPAVSILGHALTPGVAVFKGQDLGVLLALLLGGVSAAAWLPYRSSIRWSPLTYATLGLLLVAWAYQIIRIQADDALFNLTAFVVPLVVTLILFKPFSLAASTTAMLVMSYSILSISATSLLLGWAGLMPSGFDVSDAGPQRIPMLEWMGIDSRWGGPFGSVNLVAPAGGLLVVFGLCCRGWHRLTIAAGGTVMLLLGGSRTALLACAAACLIIVLWSRPISTMKYRARLRWLIASVSILAGAAVTLWRDPSLNGRLPIWDEFLALALSRPVLGVGESGIREYLKIRAEIPGVVMHDHAHSVLLDIFARHGGILVVLSLTIFLLAFVVAVIRLRDGQSGALAVVTFVVVAGLTETVYSWDYWTIYLASLLWVAAVPAQTASQESEALAESHSPPGSGDAAGESC